MNIYYACAYDDQGNLFIDGSTTTGGIEFAELPAGSSAISNITLDKKLENAGAVQWDGTYITVEDGSTIYRLSVSGSTGTVVGTTKLLARQDAWKSLNFIYHHRVIAPDGAQRGHVGFWPYPSGGKPVKVIAANGVRRLFSATMSVAPQERR